MDRIKPSDFRMPVVFQQSVEGAETRYGKEITWVEVYSDRGKLETKADVSRDIGEQPTAIRTHTLTIRFRPDFSEAHRVCMNDTYYRIVASNPLIDGRHAYIEVHLDQEKANI